MKRFFGFVLSCAVLAIPLSAAPNSQKIVLPSATQVGTSVLPAGEYKVNWTENANSGAQVTFEKSGVPSVTVSAKVVNQKNDHNGISVKNRDGKEILETIMLRKINLVLSPDSTGSATTNGAN